MVSLSAVRYGFKYLYFKMTKCLLLIYRNRFKNIGYKPKIKRKNFQSMSDCYVLDMMYRITVGMIG